MDVTELRFTDLETADNSEICRELPVLSATVDGFLQAENCSSRRARIGPSITLIAMPASSVFLLLNK